MYNRLPRAVLPRGILLRHIFLGEPAFSNHNVQGQKSFARGPSRGMGSGLAVHTGESPKFWDDLLGTTWTVHERSANSSNLKCSSRRAVARGEFAGSHKILPVRMINSPSAIPTYFAETYNEYTNWQRGNFDEGSTRCSLEQSRYVLGTSNVLSSSRQNSKL
jgi:hypothetical protein